MSFELPAPVTILTTGLTLALPHAHHFYPIGHEYRKVPPGRPVGYQVVLCPGCGETREVISYSNE